MTGPDYPLLAPASSETYQLAHIATYIAERLARHRGTGRKKEGRRARVEAVRDLTAAATALDSATGAREPIRTAQLPRPVDAATFAQASRLLNSGPRSADVVSLAGAGREGWAVVGNVPGIGPVGAIVGSHEIAEALRVHLLTRPVGELAPWAVTREPVAVPTLPERIDLATFVQHLDPERPDDRAVARALRGVNRSADAAIRDRFRGSDLDARQTVRPTTSTAPTAEKAQAAPTVEDTSASPTASAGSTAPPVRSASAVARRAAASRRAAKPAVRRTADRAAQRTGIQRPTAAPTVPSTSPGP